MGDVNSSTVRSNRAPVTLEDLFNKSELSGVPGAIGERGIPCGTLPDKPSSKSPSVGGQASAYNDQLDCYIGMSTTVRYIAERCVETQKRSNKLECHIEGEEAPYKVVCNTPLERMVQMVKDVLNSLFND